MTYRGIIVACLVAATAAAQEPPGVFQQPLVTAIYTRQQAQAAALIKKGDAAGAQKLCEESIKIAPQYPGAHYNLACALARQDKKDEAFASLNKAIACGFNVVKLLMEDSDLASLREDERFKKVIEDAKKARPQVLWPAKVEAGKAKDGEAEVNEKNTAWNAANGFFTCFLEKPGDLKDKAIANGLGEAGDLLRTWYKEGSAAGNVGDFYDNHDEDHSSMGWQSFPQLTRIRFGKEVKTVRNPQLHRGLQVYFFYSGVTIGNASVAAVGQPYWRSMTRLAYTDPRAIGMLANQYANSHLYFYPEHQDHDPGHNGTGGGHGDVFPANTPYVITSQGSSGSDVVFMNAVAATLAAFRPDVKQLLVKENALMPTVQMVFRSSNKNIKKAEDYLTGKAHPSVFEGTNIDMVRMVKMAHDIKAEEVPPLVHLRVLEEDRPVLGRDYFDAEPRGEMLFNTPSAIARIMRSTAFSRRMVVSAENSRDINKNPLKFHWVVLRGDPKGITIKPLNEQASKAELIVNWHERRPVEEGSKLESNRVDIGVFVHNGKHYSAPAFVTFFSLDNQKRTYEKKRIKEVDYADKDVSKNYVDPAVEIKKTWRDEYRYDGDRLIGWVRHRDMAQEEFTADGALVEKKDARGRATEARTVKYVPKQQGRNQAPLLEQQPGDERLFYEYASDDDRVGKVTKRQKIKDL